jgi:DNA sulfur modification protein DndB
MGMAGHSLMEKHPHDWKKYLKNLESVDWARSNSRIWEGRTTIGGVVSKARINLILTANYLKKVFDLPLTVEEQKLEKLVRSKVKEERAIVNAS